MVDAVAEEGAVGEAGQRVVEGLVQQLLLEALPLGDVAGVQHDAAHDRIAEQVGGDDLGMEWRDPSGCWKRHSVGALTPREVGRLAEEGLGAGAIVGIDAG